MLAWRLIPGEMNSQEEVGKACCTAAKMRRKERGFFRAAHSPLLRMFFRLPPARLLLLVESRLQRGGKARAASLGLVVFLLLVLADVFALQFMGGLAA